MLTMFTIFAKKITIMNDCNRIIVFANQKGGVGKSTLCILFADYLAEKGLPVAIIDADLQQTIAVQRERELAVTGTDADKVPWDVVSVETDTLSSVEEAMAAAKEFPGTILIDAPGNLADDNIVPIYANADYIIAPMSYHPNVIDSTRRFAEVMKQLQKSFDLKCKIWFLPNRIDDRKKADLEQLKLDTWKALHNYGDILTRINDRAYLERCSTLSLTSQQSGAVRYAFDRITAEIEDNEK